MYGINIDKCLVFIFRNPSLEDEEWPEYSKDNPVYRIFNAEGDGKHPKEHFGKGPMASACAFWNTYLPRLKTWTGKLLEQKFSLLFQLLNGLLSLLFPVAIRWLILFWFHPTE